MSPPMCLFCKIVAGTIPATVVAKSTHSLAFRDIEPQAPTHVLVIPRRHVGNVADLAHDPQELADLFRLAGQVAEDEGLDRGYRMVANTGSLGGQVVFHAHVHVLGGRRMQWPPG
ncbi:MAG: histidine triad nucleotide-binding protein [Dermatophilaceae bacterium]|nr:histidine triad nucleotide-binding protein [Actinomycetales bacterium]MBP8880067.1 histidine triad nucleotide-binding protein [Dermatophilaceae bacterium]MBP9918580.1 histidine triad nucleotide-binding protein [Dermatophilaceae bacterium]